MLVIGKFDIIWKCIMIKMWNYWNDSIPDDKLRCCHDNWSMMIWLIRELVKLPVAECIWSTAKCKQMYLCKLNIFLTNWRRRNERYKIQNYAWRLKSERAKVCAVIFTTPNTFQNWKSCNFGCIIVTNTFT